MYIYQHENWPHFIWDKTRVLTLLAQAKWAQGLLLGKMQNLGFEIKGNAQLQSLTEEIFNQIEGQLLNVQQVRSSIARKLGMPAEDIPVSQYVEGTGDMMLDAAQYYNAPVNKKRLCAWHKNMFPSGKSGWYAIQTGCYRNDKLGPMQVVSGPMGMEKVHYQAPDAMVLDGEMEKLFDFVNNDKTDNVIKAGIIHLWFVILQPFDDGNGRIAQALTDLRPKRKQANPILFYVFRYRKRT